MIYEVSVRKILELLSMFILISYFGEYFVICKHISNYEHIIINKIYTMKVCLKHLVIGLCSRKIQRSLL